MTMQLLPASRIGCEKKQTRLAREKIKTVFPSGDLMDSRSPHVPECLVKGCHCIENRISSKTRFVGQLYGWRDVFFSQTQLFFPQYPREKHLQK